MQRWKMPYTKRTVEISEENRVRIEEIQSYMNKRYGHQLHKIGKQKASVNDAIDFMFWHMYVNKCFFVKKPLAQNIVMNIISKTEIDRQMEAMK